MKIDKNNLKAGAAKMELLTQQTTTTTKTSTFKRSRSFRASAKLMHKFRSHTNIRTAIGKMNGRSELFSWRESLENTEDLDHVTERNRGLKCVKEINDLGGIVGEVKKKLTLNERTGKEKEPVENSAKKEKSNNFSKNSRNNYWNSIDTHSYENPTFSLDASLDSSVSECLFSSEPGADNFDKIQDCVDIRKSNKSVICLPEKKSSVTIRAKSVDYDRRMINCSGLIKEDKKNELDSLIDEEGEDISRRNHSTDLRSSSWIMSRSANFRFGAAGIKEKILQGNSGKLVKATGGSNVAGFLAIAATSSKSHSFQGMEFLEGFGKKKQHQSNNQSNSLTTNINPLTAQPSLNIHVHDLFVAVEQGHLEKVRTILESTDVDVNSVNSDGLSTLDVAVLSNNRALAKMLIAYGAREGNRFTSPESLDSHLASLLSTAELRAQELGGGTPSTNGCTILEVAPSSSRSGYTTSHSNSTGCSDDAEDKHLATWERRIRALRKMLLGFDQSRPPDTSFQVVVDVTGTNSIVLKFQESDVHDCSPICTKFKVQWSANEDFSSVQGERELLDMKQRECRIDGLVHGQRYYLRAAAGNIKGWSRFIASTPGYVTPSSWRDLEGKLSRYGGRIDQLETLFGAVSRSEYAQETSGAQRRNHKKKTTTIKQLFTATSKFQKSLRRGIFLASLLYHEDKVLVTNEDFLPVIEVDETYSPSCIYNDFHWLMKVACTWDDVKSLRQDMEKSGQGSSSNHLRLKLLQAAAQMQAALCVQDLGQIYFKPMRDVNGTMVISTVNYVKTTKSVSIVNGRWLPLNKVIKKIANQDNGSVADVLMSSIQSQMTYHQLSGIKLTRGLYLGYLKMQSSVDLVQVFVPSKAPNVLPHCKIRDNPHVSAEEWHYLKRIMRIQTSETTLVTEEKENVTNECLQITEQQKLFVDLVSATSRRLFSYMEIGAEDSQAHRLYDAEVIELTNQVSLIVIVPPADLACSAPGTREALVQRSDLLVLPIQVFEMIHLSSYQKKMLNLYSRLSCILELDTAQAQHNHREAFSSSELEIARDRLVKLQDLQCRVNGIWKESRWLIDLITFARDRGNSGQLSAQAAGISITNLLNIDKNKSITNGHSLKRSLLQLPPRDPKLVKSSPGRGSWPGPNLSNSSFSSSSSSSTSSTTSCNVLTSELSKSEQQLPNKGANGQYTRKCSVSDFSADSHGENDGNTEVLKLNGILPLSKSEDSLLLTKYKHSPRNRSVTSLTSVSSTNTSLSGNTKNTGFSNTFMNVSSNVATNTWSITSGGNPTDNMHSINSNDDYTLGNSVVVQKTKFTKPTASVAAVATPSIDSQVDMKKDENTLMPAPLPGILQVYAAYQTGLASGTSLKLHVTPRTTAREVVDLVVKQLNMAVVLKGQEGPIYTADELPNFCLVAVIGARERCLRDDFKPLQLQNPWKKGRLYVRQKHDVLAALEHSSKQTAYL